MPYIYLNIYIYININEPTQDRTDLTRRFVLLATGKYKHSGQAKLQASKSSTHGEHYWYNFHSYQL